MNSTGCIGVHCQEDKGELMKWISVDERLPDKQGMKIVFVPTLNKDKPFIGMAWFEPPGTGNQEGWQNLSFMFCEAITHYMELPEPPN